ncbi:Arc family DNA-binding protein [Chromobacterium violaceum]|uniref:Arc family DNA-binding protein n=1 Tax=Chromobacterium violaceum TaxID=536 RepID=UPI003CEA0252
MNDRHTIQPYPLRLQRELRAELEAAAKDNGRSLHSEIVQRLEQSFRSPVEQTGEGGNPALPEELAPVIQRLAFELAEAVQDIQELRMTKALPPKSGKNIPPSRKK